MIAVFALSVMYGCKKGDELVHHPNSIDCLSGGHCNWIRSEYEVTKRSHEGNQIVFTLRHGKTVIHAHCSGKSTTDTGEDLPSKLELYDPCGNITLGKIMLERPPAQSDALYHFKRSGKHGEETVITITQEELEK